MTPVLFVSGHSALLLAAALLAGYSIGRLLRQSARLIAAALAGFCGVCFLAVPLLLSFGCFF